MRLSFCWQTFAKDWQELRAKYDEQQLDVDSSGKVSVVRGFETGVIAGGSGHNNTTQTPQPALMSTTIATDNLFNASRNSGLLHKSPSSVGQDHAHYARVASRRSCWDT